MVKEPAIEASLAEMESYCQQPSVEVVKCVIVGDSGVGKTRLVCSRACGATYTLPQLMQTTSSTVWAVDHYSRSTEILKQSFCNIEGVKVSMRLWDTFGNHDRDRRFAYSKADIVLLCYNTVRPATLKNAQLFWYPEIRRLCPDVPVVLVGCQIDLRYLYNDADFAALDKGAFFRTINEHQLIFPETGRKVAAEHGSVYYETSCLTQDGIQQTFENILRIALRMRAVQRVATSPLYHVQPPVYQVAGLPPANRLPDTTTFPSSYRADFNDLLHNEFSCDVSIVVRGVKIVAHRFVLGCCSPALRDLFALHQTSKTDSDSDTDGDLGAAVLAQPAGSNVVVDLDGDLFSSISLSNENGERLITNLVIRPENGVEPSMVRNVIAFMYKETSDSLCLDFNSPGDHSREFLVYRALARSLGMENLVKSLDCKKAGDHDGSETAIHQFHLEKMSNFNELLLSGGLYKDVIFRCDDGDVAAHRSLLVARCDWMNSLFNNNFKEGSLGVIPMPGVSTEVFRCLQIYLYTDVLEDMTSVDIVDLMELANRFCQRRLLSLIQSEVISHLKKSNENNECVMEDVIDLLEPSRSLNAPQLALWCMVFLSNNYYAMLRRLPQAFATMHSDVQHYLIQHRWPPEWYLREVDYMKRLPDVGDSILKPVHRRSTRRYWSNIACFSSLASCLPARSKPSSYEYAPTERPRTPT